MGADPLASVTADDRRQTSCSESYSLNLTCVSDCPFSALLPYWDTGLCDEGTGPGPVNAVSLEDDLSLATSHADLADLAAAINLPGMNFG